MDDNLAEKRQAEMIRRASLPPDQQFVDATVAIPSLVPEEAVTWSFPVVSKLELDCMRWHLQFLLAIVKGVLPPSEAEKVYKHWKAYCAGFKGIPCHTAGTTSLDYWYAIGRANGKTYYA